MRDPSAPDADRVAGDVAFMVGGNFSSDHVGPEAYEATLQRFHAAEPLYLDAVVSHAEKVTLREALATMQHVFVLGLVAKKHPDEAASAARGLLGKYRAALAQAKKAPKWDGDVELLAEHVKNLELIVAR